MRRGRRGDLEGSSRNIRSRDQRGLQTTVRGHAGEESHRVFDDPAEVLKGKTSKGETVEFTEFREIGRRYGTGEDVIASQWEFFEKHFGTTKLTRADAET